MESISKNVEKWKIGNHEYGVIDIPNGWISINGPGSAKVYVEVAELILRAVNAYEPMREALEETLRHLVRVDGFPEAGKGRTQVQQDVFDAARAALKLANTEPGQSPKD